MTDTFRCGHERTPENTKKSPSTGARCRECNRLRINLARDGAIANDDERHAPDSPGWLRMARYGSANLLAAYRRYIARRAA